VDFDYEMMVRVLRVPDEKFRDRVYRTLRENLTTIGQELDTVPSREELWNLLAAQFAEVLGPLREETAVDAVWRAETDRLAETMLSEEWLHRRGPQRAGRAVTIRSGVQVRQRLYKAPGGLVRATAEVQDGAIASVSLSGDFFFYPAQRLSDLEEALVGTRLEAVEQAVARFYDDYEIQSPGVTPADWARVLT
jgi:lipoate-protein ligase A